MLSKIFLVFSIMIGSLYAQPSVTQVMSAVKQNPALLDTPAAKAEMSKRGIDKSEALNKIDNSNEPKVTKKVVTKKVKLEPKKKSNEKKSKKIIIEDEKDNDTEEKSEEVDEKNVVSKNNASINPLRYITNETHLELLKLKQTVKKRNKLKRYGTSFFKNKNKLDFQSTPTPDYYILSRGDVLSIWLYGITNKKLSLVIDKNGDVSIPKVGPLNIVGKQFLDVKELITSKMEKNYTNTKISINLATNSTIRVNLVGDVTAPGVYNVNSLSTIKDLLIVANGIKYSGSLREIFLKRDGKILATIDFYKLLNKGDSGLNIILRENDTIFIPKANKIISIDGAVLNPAKFELTKNESLKDLLKYAGGIKYSGSKFGFSVKRYINNQKEKVIEVDLKDSKDFQLFDGDRIYVNSIDKLHKDSIYLYGNIVRPGERELKENNSLRSLLSQEIAKYSLKGVFLENTLLDYALIKRKGNDLNRQIERVNLSAILDTNIKVDFTLQNDDEVYIFNKYNSNITPFVTIFGKTVAKKGKYNFIQNLTVEDVINMAGTTPYVKIKVTTYNTADFMPEVFFVNKDYKLSPFDTIELFDYYMINKVKKFKISGQINLPNRYTLNKNMTLLDAIELSGGFKLHANKDEFKVVRYTIDNKEKVRTAYRISYDNASKYKLTDKDEITVFKIPTNQDKKFVSIKGEIRSPGTYDLLGDGLTLGKLLKMSGGFTLKALQNEFSVVRYTIVNNESVRSAFRVTFKEASNYVLANEDEITVFKIPTNQDKKFVSIKGEIRSPGTYDLLGDGLTLGKLLKMSGGFTLKALQNEFSVVRYTIVNNESVRSAFRVTFKEASNYVLANEDEITVFKIPIEQNKKQVSINGQVRSPGTYDLLSGGLTLERLIKISGGFTLRAFPNEFEVVRYNIINDERVREVLTIEKEDMATFKLQESDEIKVFIIPNWYDRKTITLRGEVRFPGIYPIRIGEKLASVIKRAGGFTKEAFVDGAMFTRESVRKNEAKRMKDSIAKVKQQAVYNSGNAREAGEEEGGKMLQMVDIIEKQANEYVALGRISIVLDTNLEEFELSRYNMRLDDKDTLTIPHHNDTISVFGEVLNQNTFVFDDRLDVFAYIDKAGGITQRADTGSIYIVLASGEAKKVDEGFFYDTNDEVYQGSSIIVPMMLDRSSNVLFWKDISQIVYQLAITAASLSTIGAL